MKTVPFTRKKKDRLQIGHINAQSPLCNLYEIRLSVSERKPDILCVSETWLTKDVLDQHIAVPEFNVYRCDKDTGGGVCLYVRNVFTVTVFNVNIDRIKGIEDV